MRPEDMGRSGNTILYTRWDGANWTAPVDILFVPSEQIADFVAVDVDTENRLHAIWTGQSNFYYSNAPSWQADSAHVWSTPIILASDSARSAWESDIMADASGGLHVIYSKRGDMPGIYHIRSLDGGQTWSEAVRLSEPFGPLERSFCHVKIIADGMGYLHAVWQTTQDEGYGQAVYYARSVDNGEHWSAPWQFGYRDPGDTFVEWPYLTAYGVSEIHLIYIDGGTQGRLHRISLDNGRTWSGSHHIIPELEGVNGYVIPVVDGAGNMHLIANMRTRAGQLVGIYYARWNRNSWSPTIPIDNSSAAASSAHYTAATVRLGNEIYIVYNQLQGSEIWLLRGMLSSVKPLPTAELPSPIEPTLAAPAVNNVPAVSEVISRPSQPSPDWRTQPYEQSSGGEILLFSLGTSVLLVGGVMIWMRVHNRRQICRERKF
ncbi:MAG: exo-alpha-sialidase [Anaerolineae bacterium]|nr:exo-alpha-sialidase [Anaerolineae bacterium]